MIDPRLIASDINNGISAEDICSKYNIGLNEFYAAVQEIKDVPEELIKKYIRLALCRVLMNIDTMKDVNLALKSYQILFPDDTTGSLLEQLQKL